MSRLAEHEPNLPAAQLLHVVHEASLLFVENDPTPHGVHTRSVEAVHCTDVYMPTASAQLAQTVQESPVKVALA